MALFIANPDRVEGTRRFWRHVQTALQQMCPCLAPQSFRRTGDKKWVRVYSPRQRCARRCSHVAGCNLIRAIIAARQRVAIESKFLDQFHPPQKTPILGVSWKCTQAPADSPSHHFDLDACGDVDVHVPIALLAHELTHAFRYLQDRAVQGENQVRTELGRPMRVQYVYKDVYPVHSHVIPITDKDVTALHKAKKVWWNAVWLAPGQQAEWSQLYEKAEHGDPPFCKCRAGHPPARRKPLGRPAKQKGRRKPTPTSLGRLAKEMKRWRDRELYRRLLHKASCFDAWSLSEEVSVTGPYSATLVGAENGTLTVVTNVRVEDTPEGVGVQEPSTCRELRWHESDRAGGFIEFLESLEFAGVGGTLAVSGGSLQILATDVAGRRQDTALYGYTYPGFNVVMWDQPEDADDLIRWLAIAGVHDQWLQLLRKAENHGIEGQACD
jgi:hypothetical protein